MLLGPSVTEETLNHTNKWILHVGKPVDEAIPSSERHTRYLLQTSLHCRTRKVLYCNDTLSVGEDMKCFCLYAPSTCHLASDVRHEGSNSKYNNSVMHSTAIGMSCRRLTRICQGGHDRYPLTHPAGTRMFLVWIGQDILREICPGKLRLASSPYW